jgi:RHS repeat-associated protein
MKKVRMCFTYWKQLGKMITMKMNRIIPLILVILVIVVLVTGSLVNAYSLNISGKLRLGTKKFFLDSRVEYKPGNTCNNDIFESSKGTIASSDSIRMDKFEGDTFTSYYYHTDANGSVTAITDASGQLVERVTYDIYGMPTFWDAAGNKISKSSIGNNILFHGREYDTELNLYYFRARYYDPIMGRFLSTDPIGYADSMNLYQGFNMNPVNFIDPMGLDKGTTEDVRWVLSQTGIETGGEFLERDFNNFLSNFKSKESSLQYSAWWLDKYGIYVPGLSAGTKMGTAVTGTTVSGYEINEVERSNRLLWGGFEFAFLWSGAATEPKPVKFEVKADNITPENNAVPESLLKGESDTHAYLGVKNQEPVYTGVTKDPIRRASQHGDRFVLRKITDNPLTTRQAKAIEQVIIENNPQFENIINSIGNYRSWYDDAVEWGEKWLIENGFKWLLK